VSLQYRDPVQAPLAAGRTVMLASDGDRDAAAQVLNEAFAEGRLTASEHGERVRAAYAARTWGELARLTADLPGPPDVAGPAVTAMPGGLDWCLLCALVCCPPAGIAWLLAARRRARAGLHNATTADSPFSDCAGITAGAGAGQRAEDR
jgi:hypothetical protein